MFYDNTNIGQWAKERAYGFDIVRDIGNGVGYMAGAVALTTLTCGASSGAVMTIGGGQGLALGTVASAVASTTTPIVTVTTQGLAAGGITAIVGMGKNTEAAWNNGANIGEGLVYGSAMGVWEGLEMAIGHAINSFKVFKLGNTMDQVSNSLIHVGLDSIDGAQQALSIL